MKRSILNLIPTALLCLSCISFSLFTSSLASAAQQPYILQTTNDVAKFCDALINRKAVFLDQFGHRLTYKGKKYYGVLFRGVPLEWDGGLGVVKFPKNLKNKYSVTLLANKFDLQKSTTNFLTILTPLEDTITGKNPEIVTTVTGHVRKACSFSTKSLNDSLLEHFE